PLFAGADLEARVGLTFLLLTAEPDGFPHLALLSVGEVLALDASELRVALWPGSTPTRNLARAPRATLALVYDGAAYALRCLASQEADLALPSGGTLACFRLRVQEALEDRVPYAVLEHGVR